MNVLGLGLGLRGANEQGGEALQGRLKMTQFHVAPFLNLPDLVDAGFAGRVRWVHGHPFQSSKELSKKIQWSQSRDKIRGSEPLGSKSADS